MSDAPAPVPPEDVAAVVAAALAEDVGTGDLTASLVPAASRCRAEVVCRDDAVLAGAPWFDAVFAALDPDVRIAWRVHDGDAMTPGGLVCTLEGPARAIVTGERTALNFLQTLSGTATATRRYVEALAGSGTRVLDTRKTLPGLRSAQKYAVRCGGGTNHRMGLWDAVLIKENHIAAAGSIRAAIGAVRAAHPDAPVEVEVESLDELDEALAAGVGQILLDNFDDAMLAEASARARGRATLEVSGGISLEDLPRVARAGVDFVSVGALTKHVEATDFSMRVRTEADTDKP